MSYRKSQSDFKSRGHFCNYCRKMIWNKIFGKYQSGVISINEAIWHVWDTTPERIPEFLDDIAALELTEKVKGFKKQQLALIDKYTNEQSIKH